MGRTREAASAKLSMTENGYGPRQAGCREDIHSNGKTMGELRNSIIAAVITVWSLAAHGENAPSQPSAGDIAGAAKTMKEASNYLKAKRADAVACEDKIRKSDEFRPLARRIPPPGKKPAPAQLADRSPISGDEARAMTAVAPKFKTCRSIWEEAETSLVPGMGPILKQDEEKHAAIVGDLVGRKLPWGGYYRTQMALSANLKAERTKIWSASGRNAKPD